MGTNLPARAAAVIPASLMGHRTGHMLKIAHGFDEAAFARVVAILEAS